MTMLFRSLSAALWLLAGSAWGGDATAVLPKGEDASGQFVRLTRDKDKSPVAMETAIVRFAPRDGGKGPAVDLVAAVHIAEKSYYEQLNREFANYDAVLYELVAPEKASVPKQGESPGGNPLSLLQNGMKDVLELEYQLQGIDYSRKNLVHADMSPERFAQSMQQRGESLTAMCLRMMGYTMAKQGQAGGGADGGRLLMALFDKNRALALKRVVAEQFENSEGAMAALDGPQGSTIISERNKVALEVLRKEIAAGKRKIAIFYGAGHMPDLQKRLHDDFGLDPVSTRWLVAWNLKSETKPAAKVKQH